MRISEDELNQIVSLNARGVAIRAIARTLGLSRNTVRSALREHHKRLTDPAGHPELKAPQKRRSCLDPHMDTIRQLLKTYPDITAIRVLEELRHDGFKGGYSIVKQCVRELRPRPLRDPVQRFETAPGKQAQMDYSPFTIDFVEEGRRRVHLFSYVLGYSRRRYHHWVEAEDFTTTVREHIKAFEYLNGLAEVCLYDGMKVVVLRHEDEQPIYNPRFLCFCTHYGYRPWACKRYRARTKGKVERPFHYVFKNLLNGRTFHSLKHLNEVTAWWLKNVADTHPNQTTGRPPIEMYNEEKAALLPLPLHRYDTAQIAYRIVDAEGCVAYMGNQYMVPWQYIGTLLPVKITESTLVAYSPQIVPLAEYELLGRSVRGEKQRRAQFEPGEDRRQQFKLLRERYAQLGEVAVRFLDALVEKRRYGKHEAFRVLALLGSYRREDLLAAMQRAVRYGAYSMQALERILAVEAKPRSPIEVLGQEENERLRQWLDQPQVLPRPTDAYCELDDHPQEDHGDE